jgi:hypothetical protein
MATSRCDAPVAGLMIDDHSQPRLLVPSASPDETAAIVAALEQFRRETAPVTAHEALGRDPWLRAAMLEGVSSQEPGPAGDPWINT